MGRCRGRQGLHLSKVTPNASLWQSTWWTLLAPDITRRRGLGSKQIYTQKQADFKGDRLTHMLVEEFPSIQTESWVWIKGVKWIQFIKQKVRKFILEKKPVEIGFHIFFFTCSITCMSLIPGSGRSSGGGNDTPLQYSCLENSMDRGASWATVHGVAKNQTRLAHTQCNLGTMDIFTICIFSFSNKNVSLSSSFLSISHLPHFWVFPPC